MKNNLFTSLRSLALNRSRRSAPVARERLKILLAHERAECNPSDLLGRLREEILAVIGRHVTINPDKVQVKMDRAGTKSTLAVDIEIPAGAKLANAA
jgi:cell division topological specificity factor